MRCCRAVAALALLPAVATLSFDVLPYKSKCLQEDVHKDVLVVGTSVQPPPAAIGMALVRIAVQLPLSGARRSRPGGMVGGDRGEGAESLADAIAHRSQVFDHGGPDAYDPPGHHRLAWTSRLPEG